MTEEIPSFDRKLPMSMDRTEFDEWCARGKPPTAPMRREARAREEEELQQMANKFDRHVDSLPKAHKDRFWKDWKEMNEDIWFDRRLDLGEGWDTATEGIALNPKNYQRLMRNEIDRVHRTVAHGLEKLCKAIADVEKEREARIRKELGEEIRQMKSQALEEARAEIRRALNSDEAVIDLGDLRRHGRRNGGLSQAEIDRVIAEQTNGR
jgi:hypothetical protein